MFPIKTSGSRQLILVLLVGLGISCSAGCQQGYLCNGTGEAVQFRVVDGFSGIRTTVTVPGCGCNGYGVLGLTEADVVAVLDSAGNTLFVPFFLSPTVEPSEYTVFDGVSVLDDIHTAPDMTAKRTVTLRNNSGESVHIRPHRIFEIETAPSTLIPPQSALEFTTIRTGRLTFRLHDATGNGTGHTCELALAEGNEIIWDGEELSCIENPGGVARIDICNTNSNPNADSVIFVLQGLDPLTEGIFVNRGQCDVLEVPMGAPVTIEVYFNEGGVFLDDCTINDPTDGDSATWDGTEVTCEDL